MVVLSHLPGHGSSHLIPEHGSSEVWQSGDNASEASRCTCNILDCEGDEAAQSHTLDTAVLMACLFRQSGGPWCTWSVLGEQWQASPMSGDEVSVSTDLQGCCAAEKGDPATVAGLLL